MKKTRKWLSLLLAWAILFTMMPDLTVFAVQPVSLFSDGAILTGGEPGGEGQPGAGDGSSQSQSQDSGAGDGSSQSQSQGPGDGSGSGQSQSQDSGDGSGSGQSQSQDSGDGSGSGQDQSQDSGDGSGSSQDQSQDSGDGNGSGQDQSQDSGDGNGSGQGESQDPENEETPGQGSPETLQEDPPADAMTVAELAESYYGKDADNPQTVASVTLTRDTAVSEVRAGQTLTYSANITFNAAPSYNYVSGGAQPLFDTYESPTLRLWLPEGLSAVGDTFTYAPEEGCWVAELEDVNSASASTQVFSFNVLVDGNGAVPVGKDYDGEDFKLELSTSFAVYDKTNPASPVFVNEYPREIDGTKGGNVTGFTAVSDDRWGVEKESLGAAASQDGEIVTFTYEIQVGLMNEGTNELITDRNTYARDGRAPFEGDSFTLTEALELEGSRDHVTVGDLKPLEVVLTENFGEEVSRTLFDADAGTDLLETPVSVGYQTCGGEGLSGVDKDAPYYSTYTVEVTYDRDAFVAEYHHNNQEALTLTNTATLGYQLQGEKPQTYSDSASEAYGDVTVPAALTVKKYILPYGGGTTGRLYSAGNFPAGDLVSGDAVFTITAADGTAPPPSMTGW